MTTRHFGYIIETGPAPITPECDTATCGHCNSIMKLPPAKDANIIVRVSEVCPGCQKFICGPCKAEAHCLPWEKKLDAMEKRDRMLKAIGV